MQGGVDHGFVGRKNMAVTTFFKPRNGFCIFTFIENRKLIHLLPYLISRTARKEAMGIVLGMSQSNWWQLSICNALDTTAASPTSAGVRYV